MLSSGPVDAEGSFSIVLPGGDVLAPCLTLASTLGQLSADHPEKPTYSPADLKVYPLRMEASKFDSASRGMWSSSVGVLSLPKVGDLTVSYLYADRDGRIDGDDAWFRRGTYMAGSSTTSYQVALRKGWNTLVSKYTYSSVDRNRASSTTEVRDGARPAEVKWWVGPSF